jgi:MFS family permease
MADPDASAPIDPTPATGQATVRSIAWLHAANDFTLDFLTPLLPVGVPVAWLGVMEGAADAAAQVLKLVTGRASDRSGKRAGWVAAGYGTNALVRPLAGIGLLFAWPVWIVLCRVFDRVGKGIRGSATDALVADWTPAPQRAAVYARMRVADHLGATAGALAAAGVVACWDKPNQLGWIVLGLAVPAIAMLLWCRGLRNAPAPVVNATTGAGWWPATRSVQRLLIPITIAGLGARIGPLLVLAHVAGLGDPAASHWPLWLVCLGWAALALVQAGAAALAGHWTDRLGATRFLALGWLVGAAVFAALALTSGPWLIAAGLGWGVLTGLTEGAEKTAIADVAPKAERATAFGALGVLSAGAALVGSGAAGWLLATWGAAAWWMPAAALILGAGWVLAERTTAR